MNPRFQTLALYFPFKSPELQVPFSLLRSHLYPNAYALPIVQEAVEEYVEAGGHYESPTYLPQKFGFRKWHTPPWFLTWQSMVGSPVMAEAHGNAMRDQFLAMHEQLMLSPREAALARGALRLPEPSDNWDYNADPGPKELPRNNVEDTVFMLDEIATEQSAEPVDSRMVQFNRRNLAVAEATAKMAAYAAIVRGR